MATANLKHTWTTSIKNDSGAAVVTDPPVVITGESEVNFSVTVAAGETTVVEATIAVAGIVSGFLTSNQAVTISTNAADGGGGQVFNVVANRSISWNNTQAAANPFTTDIVAFYINNAGTALATVHGGFLIQE